MNKYPMGGFAPGNHSNNCIVCGTLFLGDINATECEPCGVKFEEKFLDGNSKSISLNCFDCNKLLEQCTCIEDTINVKNDKKFQQKLVDKLKNGKLLYQDASIYTIILDLVQGNGKEEVFRVFNEVTENT